MIQAICCGIIALVAVADQLIKYAVLHSSLTAGENIVLIPHVLQLRYVENTGAAFSMLSDRTTLLSVVTAVVIVGGIVLLLSGRIRSRFLNVVIAMVIAGGLGNLIDRVLRHFVVDYIEVLFVNFAVFNFADCFVTVGEFLLIGYLLYDIFKDSKKGVKESDGE
ncbi:MAG TPA: signal peptidase II [Ruminococcaceae bacterium]|nr:signal peptidase II [Oscillospiraceae bacterium]